MFRPFTFLTPLLFVFSINTSRSQDFRWAKAALGKGWNISACITVDASGNSYSAGTFEGTVDFDPGAGIFDLTSSGKDDIFILKLDRDGKFVWARHIGGDDYERIYAISADHKGDIVFTGSFRGQVDFDPGPGNTSISSAGLSDIYISKMDANGNFLWVKTAGGTGNESGEGITFDKNGNIYLTGAFSNTVDFDPGPGTHLLTSMGDEDIFISRMSAEGNFVWAKSFGGGSYDDVTHIASDPSGNIYTTGSFKESVDFDPGPSSFNLTCEGIYDIFVSKLDSTGNFIWAGSMNGSTRAFGTQLAFDNDGNIYMTGWFDGTVDFDPGAGSNLLTSNGSWDAFVCKLNQGGNLLWAIAFGGTEIETAQSVAVDAIGNIYVAGSYSKEVDFDPGQGSEVRMSKGSRDIFISKIKTNGTFSWVKTMGGDSDDFINSMTLDKDGNILSTGSFQLTADFDPGPDIFNLPSNTAGSLDFDIFVHKLSSSVLAGISDINGNSSYLVYPNPANGLITVESEGDFQLSVYNMGGQVLYERSVTGMISHHSMYFLPAGIYFLQLKNDCKTVVQKLIIAR